MLESVLAWFGQRLAAAQRILFRPVLKQLEQHRRETLELERLLLAIARVEGLGGPGDAAKSDRPDRDA